MAKPRIGVVVEMTVEDVLAMDFLCAWKGCRRHAPGLPNMLPGWRCLVVWEGAKGDYFADPTVLTDRDGVLCPEHADKLEALLVDIGLRFDKPKGNA